MASNQGLVAPRANHGPTVRPVARTREPIPVRAPTGPCATRRAARARPRPRIMGGRVELRRATSATGSRARRTRRSTRRPGANRRSRWRGHWRPLHPFVRRAAGSATRTPPPPTSYRSQTRAGRASSAGPSRRSTRALEAPAPPRALAPASPWTSTARRAITPTMPRGQPIDRSQVTRPRLPRRDCTLERHPMQRSAPRARPRSWVERRPSSPTRQLRSTPPPRPSRRRDPPEVSLAIRPRRANGGRRSRLPERNRLAPRPVAAGRASTAPAVITRPSTALAPRS
jgi:hypothetical protein